MRGFLAKVNRDYVGGLLMLALGLASSYQGASYKIGTLSRMEPGFFPVALGVLLALCGVAIMLTARRVPAAGDAARDGGERAPAEWRGWSCIVLGILAFVVLGKYGGLIPATFAIVFVSALGDRQNSVKAALILASASVVACVLVFWWILQMQFPLFAWG